MKKKELLEISETNLSQLWAISAGAAEGLRCVGDSPKFMILPKTKKAGVGRRGFSCVSGLG